MDKYFDYEAQKAISENEITNISLTEVSGIFSKLVNIVKKKIYNEDEKENEAEHFTFQCDENSRNYELVEVVSQ
jgi:hypothetical protein